VATSCPLRTGEGHASVTRSAGSQPAEQFVLNPRQPRVRDGEFLHPRRRQLPRCGAAGPPGRAAARPGSRSSNSFSSPHEHCSGSKPQCADQPLLALRPLLAQQLQRDQIGVGRRSPGAIAPLIRAAAPAAPSARAAGTAGAPQTVLVIPLIVHGEHFNLSLINAFVIDKPLMSD